ncbi:sensor histidine kinase [Sorangium sp. So ce1000]|uniref:sensor histidine kinase n=1 Tax=Sorangium sp. So ce1000 TaxID=3133325 RepID=UPI003F624ECB
MAGVTRKKAGKNATDGAEAAHGRTLRGRATAAPLRAPKRGATSAAASGPRSAGPATLRARAPRRSKADAERHAARGDRGDTAKREHLEEQCQLLERRAEAAERILRETVSTISHDLRNSLSVIVVSARMLMRSNPPEGPGRRQIEAITRAADEINQLAQDLVDAMSIENGSLKVGKGAHEVEPILDRAIELVAPTVALKPLEIAKELPHELPPIACDRERIVQVIATLLGNAMRFTPKGGRITVRAEPSGTDARFSISDTGPGIAPDQQPLLFARHAPPRRPMGQGMGLAAFVTKGIVEAHGGTIWVESSPGQGSTFFFTIPAAGLSVRAAT